MASESEETANLLELWGFLDHTDLWYGLVNSVFHHSLDLKLAKWRSKLAEHEMEFYKAIRILRRYSLVDTANVSVRTHDLRQGTWT